MDQFILEIPNAFSSEYCQDVINYFQCCQNAGLTLNRQSHEKADPNKKTDEYIYANGYDHLKFGGKFIKHFTDVFWDKYYPMYVEKFPILTEFSPHTIYDYKIQRTQPGQGYHVWHCENHSRSNSSRILVWTLYLNTIDAGGETEFLYQHCRIKPVQGTLVIWPASFTHTHRGNPPLSDVKYIVTGWIEF